MEKHLNRIVVWDPKNEFWEGGLVDSQVARELEAHGAVVLPVEPHLFKFGGTAGYSKRSYGGGEPMDGTTPRGVGCVTMQLVPGFSMLWWAARILANEDLAEQLTKEMGKEGGKRLSGQVRLIGDSAREGCANIHASPETPMIDFASLVPGNAIDGQARLGWILRGRSKVSAGQMAHAAFSMWGIGPGLRIAWVAATLTKAVQD